MDIPTETKGFDDKKVVVEATDLNLQVYSTNVVTSKTSDPDAAKPTAAEEKIPLETLSLAALQPISLQYLPEHCLSYSWTNKVIVSLCLIAKCDRPSENLLVK